MNIKHKKLVLVGVLAAILVGAGVWLVLSANRKAANHVVTPASPSASQGPGKDTTQHAGPGSEPSTAPQSFTPNPDHPQGSLARPITQLSQHKATAADTLESTCQSLPGATCFIQATMNGQTVVVSDTKTISGDNVAVIFDWPVNKLSPGTWSVQAVATKDGQKATSYADSLEVTP